MPEISQLLQVTIIWLAYIIVSIAIIGITLKSIFYWAVTLSWNYLGRCFCAEYNKRPPDGKIVDLHSLRGTGGYFMAIYHFADYDVPRMLNIDEGVFKMVLKATVKINNAKEKALKRPSKKKAQ